MSQKSFYLPVNVLVVWPTEYVQWSYSWTGKFQEYETSMDQKCIIKGIIIGFICSSRSTDLSFIMVLSPCCNIANGHCANLEAWLLGATVSSSITKEEQQAVGQKGPQQPKRVACLLGSLPFTTLGGEAGKCNSIKQSASLWHANTFLGMCASVKLGYSSGYSIGHTSMQKLHYRYRVITKQSICMAKGYSSNPVCIILSNNVFYYNFFICQKQNC